MEIIWAAVRPELTWTHYRTLLPIKNENERNYYINLVMLNNLSVRELQKEIKNKIYRYRTTKFLYELCRR